MTRFLYDVRFALRGFRKRPVQGVLVALTLAVGLAANAAIFSGLNALVLRSFDFPNLPRLARISETSPSSEVYDRYNVAPANLHDWQASGAFESLVALGWWDANLRGRDLPERVAGFLVSPAFFTSLGITPPLGRGFLPEEGQEGKSRQVVLGHDLWRRSFGADPDVLGQTVTLNGEAYSVVGVAPEGFTFPEGAEVWAPLVLPPPGTAARDRHYLGVFGLLPAGRALDAARATLEVVAQRLQTEYPQTNASRGVEVLDMQRGFEDAGIRPVMGLWEVAAGLVLLIACVNVANLLLARGAERQRELAVRLALGADRRRVVRQLLTEGLVLAGVSIPMALPLGAVASREMRRHMPPEIVRFIPGWSNIGLDLTTVAFTCGLGLVATLLFAALPAVRSSRLTLTDALKEGGRSATVGASRQRGRDALVVAQVAFALTLLVVAGLALKSVHGLLQGPQGYDPDRLLSLRITLPDNRYGEPAARRAFARTVETRLRELPGATQVAFANVLPARPYNVSRPIQVEGEPPYDPSNPPTVDYRTVSPAYFETLRLPVLSGRALSAADDDGTPPVAVVSRSLAERYWPGRDPLGRRFRAGGDDTPWVTVVGVCGDVIQQWFSRRNHPTVYRPYGQNPGPELAFAVRLDGDPDTLLAAARQKTSAVDPYLPAYDVRSMHRSIRISTIGMQYVAGIMSVFGAVAVVLALSGIYGVMSYRTSLRTQEIGVRVALGASRADVMRLAMGQAVWLTAIGLLAGGALGVFGARALSAVLFGAVPFDALTFAAFSGLLGGAALFAAWVPARRALSVDPVAALRAE
jgi:putative ABC transport system permease protein